MHNRRLLLAGCFMACICIAVCQSNVLNQVGSGSGSSGEIPGEGSGANSARQVTDSTLIDDEDVTVEKASKAGDNAEISGEGSGDVIVEKASKAGENVEISGEGSGFGGNRKKPDHSKLDDEDVMVESARKAGSVYESSSKGGGKNGETSEKDLGMSSNWNRTGLSAASKQDVEGEKAPKAVNKGDHSGESSGLSSNGDVSDASLIDDEDVKVEVASPKGGNNVSGGSSHGEDAAGMGSGSGSGSDSGEKDAHVAVSGICELPEEPAYLKNHLPAKKANGTTTTLPSMTTNPPTTITRQLHTTHLPTSSLAISEGETKISSTSSNQVEIITAATERLPEIIFTEESVTTREETYKTDATKKKTVSLTTLSPASQKLLKIKTNHIPVVATKDFQNDMKEGATVTTTEKTRTALPADTPTAKEAKQSMEMVAKDPNMILVSLPHTAKTAKPVVTDQQGTALPKDSPFQKKRKHSKYQVAKNLNMISASPLDKKKNRFPILTEQQGTAFPKDIPFVKKTKQSKEKIAVEPNLIPVSLPDATKTSHRNEPQIDPPYKAIEQVAIIVVIVIALVASVALVLIVVLIALRIYRLKSSSDFYDRPKSKYKRLAEV